MDSERKVPVPRIIYESIEDALMSQVRKLAIDICKTLNVNEKPLIDSIKKDKISLYTIDDANESYLEDCRCKAYEKIEHVYVPCSDLVVYKKDYCVKHMTDHITKAQVSQNEILYILNIDNMKYYRDKNNNVYNSEFKKIGFYNSSNQTIYELIIVTGEED